MANSAKSVSIIGGADGPTSIFIAGKQRKQKLSQRIKRYFYKKKRARIEKTIVANPHTLDEVTIYIKDKYNALEISQDTFSYLEEKKYLKESIQEFMEEAKMRTQKATEISDEIFPMDFHIYEIISDDGQVRISIEKNWIEIGISYSSNKKRMKKVKAIANDIYLYYGVTQEDIEKKTQRYFALVAALSV